MGDVTCCPIADCMKPVHSNGMCGMHSQRVRRYGDPHFTKRPGYLSGPEQRFWLRVDADGDCWVWLGALKGGYGTFRDGRMHQAHRWCYEKLVGVVPAELTLDHLCRNRACVNPDHLEPVSQAVNTLRGFGAGARNAIKTRCKHGHPLSPGNTYWTTKGTRECRTCRVESSRRNRAKYRVPAAPQHSPADASTC